jgi:hypothetical protein
LLPSVCLGQPCASAALAVVIDLAAADLDPGIPHLDLCSAPHHANALASERGCQIVRVGLVAVMATVVEG